LQAHYQIRIHIRHVLGDQTELWHTFFAILVTKGHWFKRQDYFAGFSHRLDVLLEPPGGTKRAQLSG
jgi:hypothetical protein